MACQTTYRIYTKVRSLNQYFFENRYMLIHKCDQVDFDVILDVVESKLPQLLTLLEPLLPSPKD